MILWLIGVLVITIGTALYFRSHSYSNSRLNEVRSKLTEPASLLVVMGSGGHTSEMLKLVKALGDHYRPRCYVIADTDTTSQHKVHELEQERRKMGHKTDYQVCVIPRSREVKQSYWTSVVTTLKACAFSLPLVFRFRPEVILCNGPGTCIPICFAGLLLKVMQLQRTLIVYVESFCRVTSLSLSGKILYYFSDCFYVQWPDLLHKYPKATYLGRLV